MRTNAPVKKVTIVFENLSEATFHVKDLDGFFFEVSDVTYMMMGDGFDIKPWIKSMALQIKESANKYLTSLTGEVTNKDLFTYIEEFGIVTQIVLDYGTSTETFYVDEDLIQKTTRKEDGLNIFIQ